MLIPFGNGKLAQEGRGFASKGNPGRFFERVPQVVNGRAHVATHAATRRRPLGSQRPRFFLTTQRRSRRIVKGARGQSCSAPQGVLPKVNMASPWRSLHGKRHVSSI